MSDRSLYRHSGDQDDHSVDGPTIRESRDGQSGIQINVFSSAEDEGFIADVPGLPSCSAYGATPTEAVGEVQVAIAAWLSVALESGVGYPSALPRHHLSELTVTIESTKYGGDPWAPAASR